MIQWFRDTGTWPGLYRAAVESNWHKMIWNCTFPRPEIINMPQSPPSHIIFDWLGNEIKRMFISQCQTNVTTINITTTFPDVFIFLFALLKLHLMINFRRHEGKWQNILYFWVFVTFFVVIYFYCDRILLIPLLCMFDVVLSVSVLHPKKNYKLCNSIMVRTVWLLNVKDDQYIKDNEQI